MISQPVHGHSRLKLYLYFLADLHIQANHLPAVEMYLNGGPFIRETPGESPPYVFFFSHLDYCDSLCSSLQFLKVFLPPYNSSKMLQQCLKEKRSLLQLPVSFRIDFLRFYFHGSAGCVPWLYPNPWSPVQFEILRLDPFGCFLIENNTFRFFRSCMWGECHKRLIGEQCWTNGNSMGTVQDGLANIYTSVCASWMWICLFISDLNRHSPLCHS